MCLLVGQLVDSLVINVKRRVDRFLGCGWEGSGSGNRDGCDDECDNGCDNGCSGSGELVVFLGHVKRLMQSAERVIQEDIRFREGLMSGGRTVRMG